MPNPTIAEVSQQNKTVSETATKLEFGLRPQGSWTYEDWLHFPNDGWTYEIIDGVLYMSPPPGPGHQRSSRRLSKAMGIYIDDHDLGELVYAPCGVHLPNQPVPVEPDLFFIRKDQLDIIRDKHVKGVPDLVVEILSPSNASYDRETKFDMYQIAGVPEYWLVDYLNKTVEVFILSDGIYSLQQKYEIGDTVTSEQLAGLTIAVQAIFDF